jgi:Rieske Fe-S protein
MNVHVQSRRDVLVFGGSAFALGASGCAILRGGAVHPQWEASKAVLQTNELRLPLEEVKRVGPGRVLQAKLEPGHRDLLFGLFPDGSVAVITANCTHNGCVVDFAAEKSEWVCPCHESRFSLDGTVRGTGPARRPLVAPPHRVEEGMLVVELASVKR